MPSADDKCASCACAPVPIVMTSPIAEMPGTLVRNSSSTLTKPRSSARPASAAPSPSVTGPRPVATSSFSIVSDSALPAMLCISIVTDPSFTLADVTFVAVRTAMPRFRKHLSSSADTASSSFGTMRGSSSISVTSLPNRRKIDANSTPTAPLPMIAIDFGTAGRWIASSLVMMCFLSISMPGTLRGADPVAMTISRARSVCASAPVTSTVPLPASRAGALHPRRSCSS